MIDLDDLDEKREAACIDKVDLFDFYNRHWSKLIAEIRQHRARQLSLSDEERNGLELALDVMQERASHGYHERSEWAAAALTRLLDRLAGEK